MSIARFKYGNCDCGCNGVDVPGHKVGRVFHCLVSYAKMKGKEQFDKQVKKQKQRNGLKADNGKVRALDNKLLDGNAAKEFEKLQLFFKDAAKIIATKPYCRNCELKGIKTWIPPKYYRAATAHIFMKSIFRSVATHPDNFLVLSAACGCHSAFDKSVEDASKMPIWEEACRKFEKFESEIIENHKYYDLFRKYYIP